MVAHPLVLAPWASPGSPSPPLAYRVTVTSMVRATPACFATIRQKPLALASTSPLDDTAAQAEPVTEQATWRVTSIGCVPTR